MRKALAILMFCVYALLSVGVQLHLHYCCGKLADIHLFSNHGCSHHNDEHHDSCSHKTDCCSFIDINLKVDENHEQVTATILDITSTEIELPVVISYAPELSAFASSRFHSASDPPDEKRYLLYQSLVLYA